MDIPHVVSHPVYQGLLYRFVYPVVCGWKSRCLRVVFRGRYVLYPQVYTHPCEKLGRELWSIEGKQ